MHAGLNWTVIIVVTYVRFCIMENVSADVCITIAITIGLSAGTWVRLSFTIEGISIGVRRELHCSGDGICVRL